MFKKFDPPPNGAKEFEWATEQEPHRPLTFYDPSLFSKNIEDWYSRILIGNRGLCTSGVEIYRNRFSETLVCGQTHAEAPGLSFGIEVDARKLEARKESIITTDPSLRQAVIEARSFGVKKVH